MTRHAIPPPSHTLARVTLLALFTLFASGSGPIRPARATPSLQTRDRAIQAIIQHAYNVMSNAAAHKNIDAWFSLKTPDFVSVATDGSTSGVIAQRAAMTLVLANARTVHSRVTVTAVRLTSPRVALATIHDHTEMTFPRPHGKISRMVTDTLAVATWIDTPQGWREKRSVSLREKGSLDGHPLR